MNPMEYIVVHSKPDNAVRAFRDTLIDLLKAIIATQRAIALGETRVGEFKRIAGGIEQLTALIGVLQLLEIRRN